MPFYTFTRKNVPLQVANLIKQPVKYSNIEKMVRGVEELARGDNSLPNEKYLSDYVKSNTAMRVKYNKEDGSYSYLLLGNWLPAYQMMDFLATPFSDMAAMLTPIVKTPMELKFNTSSFWKNSLDESASIEKYPGEQMNFLGMNITKKTATILKNIRILNDMDKLNPGEIFGGKKGENDSIWSKAGVPGVNLPGLGVVSPAKYKYTPSGANPPQGQRLMDYMIGKVATYKPSVSREFYNQDTDRRVSEYERAIKAALKSGDKERANIIRQEMIDFRKERGR